MAKLIVNPTSAARRELQLPRSILSIGRDPGNDLVLPDAMVSRRHAVIEPRGSQFVLRDCNSSNGSLVNGDRVGECSLKDGDLVAIGTTRLLFREEGEVEAAEPGAKVVQHPHAAKLECPACRADHRPGDQFCRQCGAQIEPRVAPKVLCASCNSVVPLPAKFCNVCGSALPRGAAGVEATKPQPRLDDEVPASGVAVGAASAAAHAPVAGAAAAAPAASPAQRAAVVEPPGVPPGPRRAPDGGPRLAPSPRGLAPAGRPPRPIPARQGAAGVEPANAGLRLIAALLDGAVVTLGQAVLLSPVLYYWWARDLPRSASEVSFVPILLSLAVAGLALLLGGLYYVYFWGVQGATPGKQVLGLVVVDREGHGPIGVGPALLRLLGYALSGGLLGIGFVLVPVTGRGLHDWLAGTLVVHRERI